MASAAVGLQSAVWPRRCIAQRPTSGLLFVALTAGTVGNAVFGAATEMAFEVTAASQKTVYSGDVVDLWVLTVEPSLLSLKCMIADSNS